VPIWIKICGITNAADALAAADAGADALGFMFYRASKRAIEPAVASEIVRSLPPSIAKVGVFVNSTAEFVREAIELSGIDTLQFHGEETPKFCAQFRFPFMKAFRIRDRASLDECVKFRDCAWLLDSHVEGTQGGTGVTFDWDVATEATRLHRKVIIAGGLRPETVADAVRKVCPYGVDVSSGVESAPGRKDHEKIRGFIAAAGSAEANFR
jgi:phosphoribosylanthranilate isomerase